jgi:hypothetical protein
LRLVLSNRATERWETPELKSFRMGSLSLLLFWPKQGEKRAEEKERRHCKHLKRATH